jgi:hypothetical protein
MYHTTAFSQFARSIARATGRPVSRYRGRDHRSLGAHRTRVRFLGYLEAGDQHRDHHRYVLDGSADARPSPAMPLAMASTVERQREEAG